MSNEQAEMTEARGDMKADLTEKQDYGGKKRGREKEFRKEP